MAWLYSHMTNGRSPRPDVPYRTMLSIGAYIGHTTSVAAVPPSTQFSTASAAGSPPREWCSWYTAPS